VPENPIQSSQPQIRLRRTGARRNGPADDPLNERSFLPRRPKGKRVYGLLVALLVVGGGILQYQWMQRVRQAGADDVVPPAFAEQIGRWMLAGKGLAPDGGAISPNTAGAEKIICEHCMGSGSALSDLGERSICPICQGVGFHMIRRFDPADRICPFCSGMGRVELPDTGEVGTCPRCDGRGLVRSQMNAAPAGN
jgi:hypothetical protein